MPEEYKLLEVHAESADEVLQKLDVKLEIGLDKSTVSARQQLFGINQLRQANRVSLLDLLFGQLKNPIVYLLSAAGVFSLFGGEYAEFLAILAVLVINTVIGFITEFRAVRAMQSLRDLSKTNVRVKRNGELVECDARQLVPGDILVLDAGDVLAADARLVRCANLACDESVLTGESLPVSKISEAVDASATLGDRLNMVFNGCGVTRGTAEAVVTSTGMSTELGRISSLVDEASSDRSPLEKQLSQLSANLIWLTLGITSLLIVVGILMGQDIELMIQSAVALAVAAIPEGLPIVATLALARGMLRMARHEALIEQLSSVETLGATTVILTDKTGTLTENHMRVSCVRTSDQEYTYSTSEKIINHNAQRLDPHSPGRGPLIDVLSVAALCNNASYRLDIDSGVGDPMEVALLEIAAAAGLPRAKAIESFPEIHEHAFDSHLRMMGTIHAHEDHFLYAIKGAPAAVLDRCQRESTSTSEQGTRALIDDRRVYWQNVFEEYASQGLRVLAVAAKQEQTADADPYQDLTMHGVIALNDPPRADVAGAISDAKQAGIRVVMVTGDHLATARHIGDSIGLTTPASHTLNGSDMPADLTEGKSTQQSLLEVDLFSRVNPEQKLQLINLHQRAGNVVAMTGDGVNDAPALKQADIGIAMGIRGTQVAKEAADMILKDDAFTTIIHAIREGRVIYSNIRRFTVYLLSCNLSEILIITIAVLLGLPLPLLPLQILFLNLVTDVFPAFALGTIESKRDVLSRAPRSATEPILARKQWRTIVIHALTLSMSTLAALFYCVHVWGLSGDTVTTVCFMTLALSQLWHLFGMHNWRESWLNTSVSLNGYVWMAVAMCLILLAFAYLNPQLASVLRLVPLEANLWYLIVGLSLIPWLIRETTSSVQRAFARAN